jgi:hypothetical protein
MPSLLAHKSGAPTHEKFHPNQSGMSKDAGNFAAFVA